MKKALLSVFVTAFSLGALSASAEMKELKGTYATTVYKNYDTRNPIRETLRFRFDVNQSEFEATVTREGGVVAYQVSGKCSHLDNTDRPGYMNEVKIECEGTDRNGNIVEVSGLYAIMDDLGICLESETDLTSSADQRMSMGTSYKFSSTRACYTRTVMNE